MTKKQYKTLMSKLRQRHPEPKAIDLFINLKSKRGRGVYLKYRSILQEIKKGHLSFSGRFYQHLIQDSDSWTPLIDRFYYSSETNVSSELPY